MRYQGSKFKIKKSIIPIITQNMSKDKIFIDAFGGGMNIIDSVDFPNKIGNEINSTVVSLWKYLKKGDYSDLPKNSNELSPELYYDMKQDFISKGNKYPQHVLGFVGPCCSYGCAHWNGYAHYNVNKKEDHIQEAYNGLMKQVKNFKHLATTKFTNCSYNKIKLPEPDKCVIYCDPPYVNTKGYKVGFDNDKFWNWVRKLSLKGYEIYVSEYTAPDDFICIWEKSRKDGLGTTKTGKKQNTITEKLFIYKQNKILQNGYNKIC